MKVNTGSVLRGTLSETGYDLPESLSFDEWAAEGPTLVTMARSAMFWVGDWLRYGERKFGEKYVQAVDATGYAVQTLKNAQWVCEKIPRSERKADLDFGHHAAVAGVKEPKKRREVLDRAAREGLSVRETRDVVRGIEHDEPANPARDDVDVPLGSVDACVHAALDALEVAVEQHQWRYVNDARRSLSEAVDLLEANPAPVS